MKKLLSYLCILAIAGFMMTGCTTLGNKASIIDVAPIQLCPLDYEVIADTTAEDSRTKVLGIDFAHLFKNEGAEMSGPGAPSLLENPIGAIKAMIGLEGATKAGAMYKAINMVPQADKLLEPRFTIETFSFLGLFSTCKVTVKAKAIKYTESKPRQ